MQASASLAGRASGHLLRIGRAVIDGVLPPRCLACGEIVDEADSLCGRCWAGITFFVPPWCALCGAPFPHPMEEDALCGACARERRNLPARGAFDLAMEVLRMRYLFAMFVAMSLTWAAGAAQQPGGHDETAPAVGQGLICDSPQQLHRFVDMRNQGREAEEAVRTINHEAKKPARVRQRDGGLRARQVDRQGDDARRNGRARRDHGRRRQRRCALDQGPAQDAVRHPRPAGY